VQTETTLLVFVLCIKAIVASRAITIDDSHLGDVEASKVAATLATEYYVIIDLKNVKQHLVTERYVYLAPGFAAVTSEPM
jgi:hypothetical protein